MSIERNILISVIFALVQDSKIVTAEWVEIPQFSDEAKVYRIPYTKYVRGEKYFLENQGGPTIHSFPNSSAVDEGFRRINIHRQSATKLGFPKPSSSDKYLPPESPTVPTVYKFVTTEASITEIPQSFEDSFDDTIFEDEEAATVETEDEDVGGMTTSSSDQIFVDENQPTETISSTTRPQEAEEEPEEEDDSVPTFLAYIPVELFKKVHKTLQSQPSTTKGKLDFLKRFQITLLAEIEKRLVPVVNPVRRKRESRGDHGWDDGGHEESGVGFPSLEGALMAISFLTFAVYLVQLVMMLFRNLGNTAATTGTATFLVNRNRRSVEEFTEDTARILGYLDTFAQSQFTDN